MGAQLASLFREVAVRATLNASLLHFMKGDTRFEAIMKRHGYVTLRDIEEHETSGGKRPGGEKSKGRSASGGGSGGLERMSVEDTKVGAVTLFLNATPDGRWLRSQKAADLMTAREEIEGLLGKVDEFARAAKVNPAILRAGLLQKMAVICYDEGKLTEVGSHLDRALPLLKEGHQDEALWQVYVMRGLTSARQGDLKRAANAFREAVKIIERMRSSFRSESVRAFLIEDKMFVYECLIDLLVGLGENTEALVYLERAKARVLLDQLSDPGRRAAVSLGSDAVRRAHAALAAADTAKVAWRSRDTTVEPKEVESLSREAEREYQKYLVALEELRYSDPNYAATLAGEAASVRQIQEMLDERTVLLEYFLGAERVVIFTVRNAGPVEAVVVAVGYEKLREKINRFRDAIEKGENHTALARELYDLLLRPVAERIRGKRLGIVAHDVGHFLPFHALIGEGLYVIEQHEIFYGPSATILGLAFRKGQGNQGAILSVGNPDGSLRHAESEARRVAELLPRVRLLLREMALKTRVLEYVHSADIIHFATHAELDSENPMASHLVLAAGGRLEVGEIYGIRLTAELVTLSACRTHLGRLTGGDEIISLTTAFIVAGARTVVTSLWAVDDESTAKLMVAFYRGFVKDGSSRAQALRHAQLEMIRAGGAASHPRHWAPFVLVGGYR